MSSKSDQRSLEMLYESINEFVLLKEEELFIKQCSRIICTIIDHQVSIGRFPKGSSVIQFLFSAPVKDALKDSKLELSKEEQINFVHVFIVWFYKHVVKHSELNVVKGVESIVFYKVNNPNDVDHLQAYSEVKVVPFANKQEILKNFEEMFEYYIEKDLDYLKDHHSDRAQGYLKWREEKMKFQNLRKKLPELEGIFE